MKNKRLATILVDLWIKVYAKLLYLSKNIHEHFDSIEAKEADLESTLEEMSTKLDNIETLLATSKPFQHFEQNDK